ncbi:ParB/RepB/Spo0J family partition protein [Betaproteobacteria bacterium LSUCC0115]|nr:ParB/RepB/Spo0J family partition protein [Burkholderiales bacterium LSUCC0115]
MKKKGLGRGLEALLGTGGANPLTTEVDQLPLSQIQAGQYQPRQSMDNQALQELADSIRAQGVIQPIVVRRLGRTGGPAYEIIAGERRFRAAQLAGLAQVPVVIKSADDQSALAMALIENLQRQDLSALEEAQGIARLINEFGLTHEQAAQAVGRSRSATTNLLRLLSLPEAIQQHLRDGLLEAGHARVLLGLPAAAAKALAQIAVAQKLSVREVEARARRLALSDPKLAGKASKAGQDRARAGQADWDRMQEDLADALGLTVRLTPKGKAGGGELKVQFSSSEEFQGLLDRLMPDRMGH